MKKLTHIFLLILFFTNIFSVTAFAQDTSTDEGSSIRDKVRQKIEVVKNNPKAYLGTATDKTDSGIQIKSANGEIQQISVIKEKTSFVKVDKSTTKITYNDIAIGDFLVAMGFENSNEILDAKRILLISPLTPLKREIIFAIVDEIGKNSIVVRKNDNSTTTINFPKKWKGPEIKEIQKGNKVIVIGEMSEKGLLLRTIQNISSQKLTPTPSE